MPTAYSYLRFSTPEQMNGDSFRRQTALAQEYCSQAGLTLDTSVTYSDLGVSAFRGKNAETGRLAEFLEAVKSGLVQGGSYLLVESLDRVSRQAARKALRVLEAICDEGITVVTLNDCKQYTREALDSDPMALIMSLLVFIRANEESVMKSRRLKSAWVGKRLKVKDGVPLTTKCPGWLFWSPEQQRWQLHRERAQVVRRIFQLASKGVGSHSIAEQLNRDKVPVFGCGTQWHRSYINKLLDESPAVIGTYVPHTMEYVEGRKLRKPLQGIAGYFPACVDRMVYERVRAMRTKTASPLRGCAKQVYNIFGGLVRCGRCGGPMNLQNKGISKSAQGTTGLRYVVCTQARYGVACKYTAVRYDAIEEAFLRDAGRILGLAPAAQEDFESSHEQLRVEISSLETAMDNLTDGYEKTREPKLLERIREVREELDGKRERLGELERVMESTRGPLVARRIQDLQKALKEPVLPRGVTNATIRALFSGLSVHPDSGVATLAWRHGGESQFMFGFEATP